MSQAGNKGSGGGSGGGIITINGDVGSVTGSTVSLTGLTTAGATMSFDGSGTAMTLNTTDANENIVIGGSTGVSAGSSSCVGMGFEVFENLGLCTGNTAIGYRSMNSATNASSETFVGAVAGFLNTGGMQNCGFGAGALRNFTTGSFNVAIGSSAGLNYTSSESHNVLINNQGVLGESNVLRIGSGTNTGNQGLTEAFIAGINGNTLSGTPSIVVIDPSTDQLGIQPAPFSPIAFSAYLGASTGSVTGDGTIYQVPFNNVVTNVGNAFDISTGIFTAPATGVYQFSYIMVYVNPATSNAFIEAFTSGSPENYNFRATQASAANVVSTTLIQNGSITVPLTAGNTMQINASAFGGTLSVGIGGGTLSTFATTSIFSGSRIA